VTHLPQIMLEELQRRSYGDPEAGGVAFLLCPGLEARLERCRDTVSEEGCTSRKYSAYNTAKGFCRRRRHPRCSEEASLPGQRTGPPFAMRRKDLRSH
jgi:hypothetical protein